MWCLMAEAAKSKAAADDGASGRMTQRLVTGRFFMERMLPATTTHLARIKAGAVSTMALPMEAF
jgi:hypothetical protein